MLNANSSISKKLDEMVDATQSEKQIVIENFINEVFKDMKIKRCTHEFSTPHIAKEALVIMEKDPNNFADLVIMKKINKLSAELEIIVSKATGKPLMKWIPMHETSEEMAA